jgi:hypothetical protein
MNIDTLLEVSAIMLGIYWFVDKACNALDRRTQARELRVRLARWVADGEQQRRLEEQRETEIRARYVAGAARRREALRQWNERKRS